MKSKLQNYFIYPTKPAGDDPANVEVPKKEQLMIDKNMVCAEEVSE